MGPRLSETGKFSLFAPLSFVLAIAGLFVRPLCILAIAAGTAGLVQVSRTPDIRFKKTTKILAIIGICIGAATAIFLIIDLMTMRGVFKTLADLRDDLATYLANKSEGVVGNISDITNITGGIGDL